MAAGSPPCLLPSPGPGAEAWESAPSPLATPLPWGRGPQSFSEEADETAPLLGSARQAQSSPLLTLFFF